MPTRIDYSRTQWAGGQGFFHSGTVQLGDRSVLYVYDCGSLEPASLTREISEFRSRHGDEIDLLFLSHFHADHVNGLPELLSGATVHSAVIPLVSTAERLFVFAQALATNSQVTDWYRDLIADPAAALRDIADGVEIIGIPPEEEDDDALYEPTQTDSLPEGMDMGDFSDAVVFSPGKRSVLSGAAGGAPIWEWDTMTTALAEGREQAFLDALAVELDILPADLAIQISTSAGIVDLVRDEGPALEAAYRSQFPDLNLTSLLVYSGPAAEMRYRGLTHRARSIVERGELHAWDVRPGWLGTGDQKMGSRRCSETVRRFGNRLQRVGTLALPHHGSLDSFHIDLLAAFAGHRPVCSVSVGTNNTYQHPNRRVILDVSSNGNHVVVVTEQECSRWTEAGVSIL